MAFQFGIPDISALRNPLDLWSNYAAQISLGTVASNFPLPSITIAGMPGQLVIIRAAILIKFRVIENTNALVNSLSGAQNIQVMQATGGTWFTGMPFAGVEFSVPGTTREAGDAFSGSRDVSSQIPPNGGVVNFQWALGLAAHNNLNFNDIQVGLRIWYSV
jgi:hypothetical protein